MLSDFLAFVMHLHRILLSIKHILLPPYIQAFNFWNVLESIYMPADILFTDDDKVLMKFTIDEDMFWYVSDITNNVWVTVNNDIFVTSEAIRQ